MSRKIELRCKVNLNGIEEYSIYDSQLDKAKFILQSSSNKKTEIEIANKIFERVVASAKIGILEKFGKIKMEEIL